MARRPIKARVGNYRADVDPTGEPEMDRFLAGPPPKMNKVESAYVAGAKNKDSATEAVRRARRANRGK